MDNCHKERIDILCRCADQEFQNRRKMFYQLKSGKMLDGVVVDTKNVVPHYLMYTTIGRADLVNFACYMEEKFAIGLKA